MRERSEEQEEARSWRVKGEDRRERKRERRQGGGKEAGVLYKGGRDFKCVITIMLCCKLKSFVIHCLLLCYVCKGLKKDVFGKKKKKSR